MPATAASKARGARPSPIGSMSAPSSITLGQSRWKLEPGLAAAGREREKGGELGGQQKRCLFEPQAGRQQELGEQRVARAIAITCARALGAVGGQAAKPDITERTIVLQRDEANIRSLRRPLIGVVAGGNAGTAAAVTPTPRVPVGERGGRDQPLKLGPAVELLERGDRAVPRGGGYPEAGIGAPARTMENGHVRALGQPDGLTTGLGEEPHPDHHVIAVGTQRMGRAHAVQRQIQQEAIEIGVVKSAVAQNDRDVGVESVCRSTFLDRDNHWFAAGNVQPLPRTPTPDLPRWANRHLPRAPLRRLWGHFATRAGPSCGLT